MKRITTSLFAALTAFATLQSASAHDFKVGDLTIEHPYSFATPPGSATGAGYLIVTNSGATDDRLIDVKTDFSRNMLHKTEMVDGVMKMRHQMGGIPIPAGETVTLEPGGFHVMFLDLKSAFKDGDKNAATLVFEAAGEIDVMFNVEKRDGKAMDHSGHGMKSEGDTHSGHSN